jgi:hypothetical protein
MEDRSTHILDCQTLNNDYEQEVIREELCPLLRYYCNVNMAVLDKLQKGNGMHIVWSIGI